jgi:hypothetical protein
MVIGMPSKTTRIRTKAANMCTVRVVGVVGLQAAYN